MLTVATFQPLGTPHHPIACSYLSKKDPPWPPSRGTPHPTPGLSLQGLHKACEVARRHNYFPGGVALIWATYYESCISSDQSCINEWNAMQDLESTRPDSPALFVDK